MQPKGRTYIAGEIQVLVAASMKKAVFWVVAPL
jgi:hypothetical protein